MRASRSIAPELFRSHKNIDKSVASSEGIRKAESQAERLKPSALQTVDHNVELGGLHETLLTFSLSVSLNGDVRSHEVARWR
jgi:hypothetical protein